ncbi:transmembrane protein 53-A-like [Anopheles albimanus]|uniref:AB hydrolase-1 domain-containing protein n=1 Tax=Anopheles albimanus TaxID=7167 RepID=A0A182FZY0_ANOAL|nr:transmembrane protein 53-A-like [Anopheles albimanus]
MLLRAYRGFQGFLPHRHQVALVKQSHNQIRHVFCSSPLVRQGSVPRIASSNSSLCLPKSTQYSRMLVTEAQHDGTPPISRSGPIKPVTFTKNMTFYTDEGRKRYEKHSSTLRLKDPLEKPLVLIFAWLQATNKHLAKYAELYLEQGFEVLTVHITPWQLVWPVHGSQKVARDVVKFLSNNDISEGIVLHGFSVGGYLWGECLVKLHAHPTGRRTLEKIVGQIWDSVADITEIPVGVPHAVLPRTPKLQTILRNYISYHLKLFHEEATQYYEHCTHLFHHEPAQCPALLLVSKTDPVGTETANRRLCGIWESIGLKTTLKCWDKSPHVGHFHKHREEYVQLLLTHLRSLNLPMYNRRAKL